MAHGPETRAALRAAYIYEALSLEAASQRFNVAFSSSSRWKRESLEAGDDWEKARAAARLAGQGADNVSRHVLEEFVTLFQSTITELKEAKDVSPLQKAEAMSRLSDAYMKTMRAVASTNPKLNKLAIAMETIHMQIQFIRDQYPQNTGAFVDMLDEFGKHVTAKFG